MEIVTTNFKRVLSLIDMGSDNSKPSPTLAEKRYKVERPPAKKKVRSASTVTSVAKRNSVESDMNTSLAVSREAFSETDFQGGVVREKVNESVLARPLQFENQKHFLTKRERILLEHSWKKSKKSGTEHVGSKIFLMVLTAQPDIKGIFGLEKIPQGRLKYDPRFRQHAQVFTKTFDYVIKNLEYPDKIEQHFEALGRRHVVMQGRGFDPLYWETFAECMTQTAVEWEAHKQRLTMSAWRNLVSTIISFMRRGFDEENAKRKFHQYPQRAYRVSVPSSSGNTSSTGSTGSYNFGSHSSGSYNIGYQTPIRAMSPCPSNDVRCPTFTQYEESLPPDLSYGTPNGVANVQCLAPQHVPNGSLQFARTASFCGVPGAPPQYHGMHQHVQQISKYGTNSAFSTPRNSWSGIYPDDSPMDYSNAMNDRDICSSRSMHTHRV